MVYLRSNLAALLIIVLTLAVLTSSDPIRRHYCQSELSNALHTLCKSVYNTPEPINKRDLSFNDNSLAPWHEIAKRGVADECCLSPRGCTLDEMKMYCLLD